MPARSAWSSVRHGLVIGVVAFAVFGASTAVFGQGARFHSDLPFFATSSGVSQVTGMPSPGVFTSVGTGTITGTHTGTGTYELLATQEYPRHIEKLPENPPNDCAFVDGTLTITAADGSQINGDINANRSVSCVSEQYPGPGVDAAYLATLYIQVTGGTGKFEGASGWLFTRGTSTADAPPAGQTFTDVGVLVGDVEY